MSNTIAGESYLLSSLHSQHYKKRSKITICHKLYRKKSQTYLHTGATRHNSTQSPAFIIILFIADNPNYTLNTTH